MYIKLNDEIFKVNKMYESFVLENKKAECSNVNCSHRKLCIGCPFDDCVELKNVEIIEKL